MDYRDVSFSFAGRRRRRRRRALRIALWLGAAVVLVTAFIVYGAHRSLDRAAGLLAKGEMEAARHLLGERDGSLLFRGRHDELVALTELGGGRQETARTMLAALARRGVRGASDPLPLLAQMSERGHYAGMRIYLDHLANLEGDDLAWYDAVAGVGLYDARRARNSLARLSRSFRERNQKGLALLSEALTGVERGSIPCVFDRAGQPLASWLPREQRLAFVVPGLSLPEIAVRLRQGLTYTYLTIDRADQERAAAAFADQFGSLILLSLPDGGVRVAFSRPRAPRDGDSALHQSFEPGSVIKVISLAAFLRQPTAGLFPFQCTGVLEVDRKAFYDWLPHRQVDSPEQALALSCNLSFARIGLALGSSALDEALRRFSFNAAPMTDPLFRFEMGRFSPPPWSPIHLAGLAVGLGGIRLTAVHGALVASWVALDGQAYAPHLVDHVENLFRLGIYSSRARSLPRMDLAGTAPRIRQAMGRSVEDEMGTARRAAVPGLRMGVKTGTVGGQEQGFDAILIGFYPLERPESAFCLRLDKGGKAELAGAHVLKSFLSGVAGEGS